MTSGNVSVSVSSRLGPFDIVRYLCYGVVCVHHTRVDIERQTLDHFGGNVDGGDTGQLELIFGDRDFRQVTVQQINGL